MGDPIAETFQERNVEIIMVLIWVSFLYDELKQMWEGVRQVSTNLSSVYMIPCTHRTHAPIGAPSQPTPPQLAPPQLAPAHPSSPQLTLLHPASPHLTFPHFR